MFRYLVYLAIPLLALTCCPPPQMTGFVFMDIGSKYPDGSTHRTELSEDFVSDATKRMISANQTLNMDGVGEIKQKVIQDFNTGIQYVIKGGKCERMNISIEEPGCLPAIATEVIKSFLGAGTSQIPVTMYSWKNTQVTSYLTVTDRGCVPVMYESVSVNQGATVKITAEYFGIREGISDPSLFTVPTMCNG